MSRRSDTYNNLFSDIMDCLCAYLAEQVADHPPRQRNKMLGTHPKMDLIIFERSFVTQCIGHIQPRPAQTFPVTTRRTGVQAVPATNIELSKGVPGQTGQCLQYYHVGAR